METQSETIQRMYHNGVKGKELSALFGLPRSEIFAIAGPRKRRIKSQLYDMATRTNKIHDMRFIDNMSLRHIAEREGVSHQRISQILEEVGGSGGHQVYKRFKDTLDNPEWMEARRELTTQQMADLLGITVQTVRERRKNLFYKPGGKSHNQKYKTILAVEESLRSRNYKTKFMPYRNPQNFNILVNDKLRISVGSASKIWKSNPHAITRHIRFIINKHKNDSDIFVCCLITEPAYFVIPATKIRGNPHMIYIAHPPSSIPKTKDPYDRYKDRWDLIDEALKSVI